MLSMNFVFIQRLIRIIIRFFKCKHVVEIIYLKSSTFFFRCNVVDELEIDNHPFG